jgi:hypothetical protein
MAVQIIPEQGLGESLGAGLAQGLQGLAQLKAQDLMRRQQAQYNVPLLQGLLPGVQGQQLQQLAMADPALLNQLIQRQTQLQRGSMLAGLYGDPRLANLTPDEQKTFMSSPQYQRQEAQTLAQPLINNLRQLIQKGYGSNVATNYLSKMFTGNIDAINTVAAQLKAFKDPELVGLGTALETAKNNEQRANALISYLRAHPESISSVGNMISGAVGQAQPSQTMGMQQQDMGMQQQDMGMQQQDMGIPTQQAQTVEGAIADLAPQEKKPRTYTQQAVGVAEQFPQGVLDLPELPEQLAGAALQKVMEPGVLQLTKLPLEQQQAAIDKMPLDQRVKVLPQLVSASLFQDYKLSNITEPIRKTIKQVAEYISPGSTDKDVGMLEKGFRYGSRATPSLMAFGGATYPGVATQIATGTTLAALEDAGITDPLAHFGTAVVSNLFFGKWFNALNNYVRRLNPKTPVKELTSKLYGDARKEGDVIATTEYQGKNVPTVLNEQVKLDKKGNLVRGQPGILDKLDEVSKEAKRQTTGKPSEYGINEERSLLSNIEKSKKNLRDAVARNSLKEERGNLKFNDLVEEYQNINANYIDANTTEGRLYRQYRDVLGDALKEAGKSNPKAYKDFLAANQLYTIQNWQNPATAALQQYAGTKVIEKIAKNPFFLLASPVLIGQKAAALLGVNLLSQTIDKAAQGGKILQWAYKNEQGAKLISDIIQASATNDGGAIRSTLLAFDKFLRKNEGTLKRLVGEAATLQPQQA